MTNDTAAPAISIFNGSLPRKIVYVSITAITLTTILLFQFKQMGYRNHFNKLHVNASNLTQNLNNYISKMKNSSRLIAQNKYVLERLQRNSGLSTGAQKKSSDHDILVALNSICAISGASIAYVLNPSGITIASTSIGDGKSLTGNQYRFHPYFIEAMKGSTAIFAAVGSITHKRGLYFASPVLAKGRKTPLGVVVMKMGVELIDQLLKPFPNAAGVMSPDGIIFAGNRPKWMYKSALPITKRRINEIQQIKQFGSQVIQQLHITLESPKFTLNNDTYGVVKLDFDIPGWKVFFTCNLSNTYPILTGVLAVILILLFSFSIILNLINNRKKSIFENQKKLAQDENTRQLEFLHTVLDSLAHPFYIINLENYKVELANKAAGFAKDQVGVATCYKLTHDRCKPCGETRDHQCPIEIVKRTGEPAVVEHLHHTPEGTIRNHEIHAYPIFDQEGKMVQMAEYNLDITNRKFLENELLRSRQLESIGILAGGIAHDFNNILSVIIGNIELVKDDLTEGERHHTFLENAENNAMKAADLSKKLISFARGGWLDRKKIDLRAMIKSTIENMHTQTPVSFSYSFPDDFMPVSADKRQLGQVFLNIFLNAEEAAKENKDAEITVKGTNLPAGHQEIYDKIQPVTENEMGYVKISITDKGKGIPKDIQTKVFDPYFTTKKASNKKGTGLGLSLCYSIVKKHGGILSIQSQPGIETTVDIYLPAFSSGSHLQKKPKGRV